MSGTSLDSVDAVLIRFAVTGPELIGSCNTEIEPHLRIRILGLAESSTTTLEEFGALDCELGLLFACAAKQVLALTGTAARDVVAIGSHGQTVRHRPARNAEVRGFSLQIGDPNTIAETTGICTVADFRRRDIAAGGQGAPLVPAFHRAVFGKADANRVVANIGGMANVTLLPKGGAETRGFDTGPGNALMDAWTQRHLGSSFDRDGRWASSGRVNATLISLMLEHTFFALPPPKSTGREEFNLAWLDSLLATLTDAIPPSDVQATLLELTARSLSMGITTAMPECTEVYLCGGGARNIALRGRIAQLLGEDRSLGTTEALGIHPDWVEACAFAWLAQQALGGAPGNLPSVTGAAHPVVLGGIFTGRTSASDR